MTTVIDSLGVPRVLNARPDPPEHRKTSVAHLLAKLGRVKSFGTNTFVDLDPFAPQEPSDQGGGGYCLACARGGAIVTTLAAAGTPLDFVPSHDDLYRLLRLIARAAESDGTFPRLQDEGGEPNFATRAVNEWGVRAMGPRVQCPECVVDGVHYDADPAPRNSDLDYRTINDEPTFYDLERDAQNLLVGEYEVMFPLEVRQSLSAGVAVEICGFVDSAYMRWIPTMGVYQQADLIDPLGGGHAQFLKGYRLNSSGNFEYRVQNSWGPWCDGGSIWVSEKFIRQQWQLTAIAVRKVVSQ